jgi:hypothetical protein
MPTNYKVLGQLAPTAATASTLYTVPAATQTIVSTINVVNTGGASDTVRIAIRPAGVTLAVEDYIVFNLSLSPTATFTYTSGVTLAATDVVTVYSQNGTCSFNAFGSEIS